MVTNNIHGGFIDTLDNIPNEDKYFRYFVEYIISTYNSSEMVFTLYDIISNQNYCALKLKYYNL
jgi:hypothetical protein